MKILFLDIDGVLNKASDYAVLIYQQKSILTLNVSLVDRLKDVLDDTGALVVLSSSWRNIKDGAAFLEEVGIPIHDVTGNVGKLRGDQIKYWLQDHPKVSTYAIVDDGSDMLDEQLPHFVLTELDSGLTEQAAHRLTYKLNHGEE